MKRRVLLVLLLGGLLPALACNMPVSPVETLNTQRAIQQTVDALNREASRDPSGESVVIAATKDALAATAAGVPPAGTPAAAATNPLPPLPIVTVNAPTPQPTLEGHIFQYVTQPGDTLAALELRFQVEIGQIHFAEKIDSLEQYPSQAMLPAGEKLVISDVLDSGSAMTEPNALMPDSEIVYSPTAADFSVQDYIQQAGGFLSTYSEPVDNTVLTGAQIVQRVADETSTNPRLLLAVLEYRSHWVTGHPVNASSNPYPIGFYANQYSGLYKEMTLVARQLTIGFYGWRTGQVTELDFADGSHMNIHPTVNAGTSAIQFLFSKLYTPAEFNSELYSPGRFILYYASVFGDPWQRAAALGPLLPDGLAQPALELPFPAGQTWTLTGGPHVAWGVGSAWGGLDFAPSNVEPGCGVSRFWATAAAPGRVVRSGDGEVVEDLDDDGHEQTGWVLLYLHIATQDRVAVGTRLKTGDLIGHPSCEGGFATGTHVHIARKYNGEWLAADGPLPFVLSGWQAKAADKQYSGSLVKAGQVVTARLDNAKTSLISR